MSVSLRSAAGKAALFQSILTSSKDDHTVFSSATAVSINNHRENAPDNHGMENTNPNPLPSRRVLTRSMANITEETTNNIADVQLAKRFGSKRQSV